MTTELEPPTPYYFTVHDSITHHLFIYETNELELTRETRTLIGRFPYKGDVPACNSASFAHTYERVQHLITERIRLSGGCHLITAWVQSTQPHKTMQYYHETNLV